MLGYYSSKKKLGSFPKFLSTSSSSPVTRQEFGIIRNVNGAQLKNYSNFKVVFFFLMFHVFFIIFVLFETNFFFLLVQICKICVSSLTSHTHTQPARHMRVLLLSHYLCLRPELASRLQWAIDGPQDDETKLHARPKGSKDPRGGRGVFQAAKNNRFYSCVVSISECVCILMTSKNREGVGLKFASL